MALPGEKPVEPKYKPPDETSRIYKRYPVIKMPDIPPTISKVQKEDEIKEEKPPPDYTARAEEHREELRRQAQMTEESKRQERERPSEKIEYLGPRYYALSEEPTSQYDTPDSPRDSIKDEKKLSDALHAGYLRVTRPFREYAPKKYSLVWGIGQAVIKEEKFFEDIRVKGEVASGRAQAKAEEYKLKGKDVLAGAMYAKASAITAGKAAIGAASTIIRPKVIAQTPRAVWNLLTDIETRKIAKQQIVGDPMRTVMGFSGALLGSSLVSDVLSRGTEKVKVKIAERQAAKTPSESFFIDTPESRLLEFPETIAEQKTTFQGFEKRYVKIYDDTISAEFPYMSRLPDDVPITTVTPTDLTPSQRVLWALDKEGRTTIPIDQKPPKIPTDKIVTEITKPKKGLLYRTGGEYGLVRTGEGLQPTIIPEGMGRVTEIGKPIAFIDVFEGHMPGVRRPEIPIIVGPQPSTLGRVGYLGLLGGLTSEKDLLDRIEKDILKPSSKDLLKDRPDFPRQKTRTKEITEPIIEPILSTRTGFLPIQEPLLDQPPTQIQRSFQKQLPKQGLPTPSITILPPPLGTPRRRSPKIPGFEDPLKLERKRGPHKKAVGAYKVTPIQIDPIKAISKLDRELFGTKKKRKKKKR